MTTLACVGLAFGLIGLVLIVRPLPKLGRTVPSLILVLSLLALVQSARTQAQVLAEETQRIDLACANVAHQLEVYAVVMTKRPVLPFDLTAWRTTTETLDGVQSLCLGDGASSCTASIVKNPEDKNFVAGVKDMANAYRNRVPCQLDFEPTP